MEILILLVSPIVNYTLYLLIVGIIYIKNTVHKEQKDARSTRSTQISKNKLKKLIYGYTKSAHH
jgi:hypothetical protein